MERGKRAKEEDKAGGGEDEELPLLPGQKKKRKVQDWFFLPVSSHTAQNANTAEAREMAFLAQQEATMAQAQQLLCVHFSESQQDRYEAFRRSNLRDAGVRRVMGAVTSATIAKPSLVAIKGAAKLFLGELVEEARSVMDERGEEGPLRPWHVREAYEKMREAGKIPRLEPPVQPVMFSGKRNVI